MITLIGKQGLVCWSFSSLSGFDMPPTAAHIHRGISGTTGPVVVPLGATWLPRACIAVSATRLEAIARHPNRYYVDVHSKKYPNGAVRSQL